VEFYCVTDITETAVPNKPEDDAFTLTIGEFVELSVNWGAKQWI
jgi:hypothetical protein